VEYRYRDPTLYVADALTGWFYITVLHEIQTEGTASCLSATAEQSGDTPNSTTLYPRCQGSVPRDRLWYLAAKNNISNNDLKHVFRVLLTSKEIYFLSHLATLRKQSQYTVTIRLAWKIPPQSFRPEFLLSSTAVH
jgi:hypothetical protein